MSPPTKLSHATLVADLLSIGRRVSRASLLFRDAVAAAAGLHVTDAECIDFLLERGEATAGELAVVTGLTTGAMTAAIDRLERAGFVQRARDAHDRRKVIVRPVMTRIRPFVPLYESMGRKVRKLYERCTVRELRLLLAHQEGLAAIYEEEGCEGAHGHWLESQQGVRRIALADVLLSQSVAQGHERLQEGEWRTCRPLRGAPRFGSSTGIYLSVFPDQQLRQRRPLYRVAATSPTALGV